MLRTFGEMTWQTSSHRLSHLAGVIGSIQLGVSLPNRHFQR